MFDKSKNSADEEEIRQAAEDFKYGSNEAFKLLYSRYHSKVYRFCLRMLGSEAEARDAFQETFIKIYEHRTDFRGTNFGAWLFTIARRTCLNTIRSRKEHDEFDEVYHGYRAENTEDFALKNQINSALALLPETLREALILREYNENSYQEIADILGIDLSLAKVRVHRARLILRKILTPLQKEIHES